MESENKTTLMGLHKWYVREFEKCGWMVLSKDADKITQYKKSLNKLASYLKLAYDTYEENDRKRDIKVMIYNVKKLSEFVEKSF
mgnify:FL=1